MKIFVILTLVCLSCNGQFADILPIVSNAARTVAEELFQSPIITLGTEVSSNFLGTTVDALTKVPISMARRFGFANLPTISNDKNILESADAIIGDFNIGLGNEDARLSITEIIQKQELPVENHYVTTADGYILSMIRIPNQGNPVFLMHGLLESADDFVIAGRENGLAYLLFEIGYDVWMGNSRGNKHSRRHLYLGPDESSFWDFSWHEIGVYDLPAMIDYALEVTNKTSLKYVGHSQGTTAFFVMASERPKYNEKISLMVALSPVAFMSHVRSPIVRLLAPGTPLIHSVAKSIGFHEFLPDNSLIRMFKLIMCGNSPLAEILCSNLVFITTGFNFGQLNVTNLPVMYGHYPSGASAKQFAHYGQGVVSGGFKNFDYGVRENLERYGSKTPPSYELHKITAPVSLFYSDADWLAHPTDVDRLYNELENPIDIYKVPYQQFNHIDFLLAKDVKSLVYERLQKLLSFF